MVAKFIVNGMYTIMTTDSSVFVGVITQVDQDSVAMRLSDDADLFSTDEIVIIYLDKIIAFSQLQSET